MRYSDRNKSIRDKSLQKDIRKVAIGTLTETKRGKISKDKVKRVNDKFFITLKIEKLTSI